MIEIKDSTAEKYAKMLEGIPRGYEKAMSRSINRALATGRTVATRETAKRYTLKSRDVRETFKTQRASNGNLEAALISTGANLPLSRYKHKPTSDTTGARRKQVKVSVRKGALKPLGQSFIWKGRVMQRLGATRLPIQQKYSLSVPSTLNNDGTVNAVQNAMSETVEKRLEHETKRLLEGAK